MSPHRTGGFAQNVGVRAMSDYASIMGGAPDSVIGQTVELDEVARNWDAYYYIQSENVFLDRFGTSGDSLVDASDNLGGVEVELGSGSDTVTGGAGGDRIYAGTRGDVGEGGGRADTITGAAGGDPIVG